MLRGISKTGLDIRRFIASSLACALAGTASEAPATPAPAVFISVRRVIIENPLFRIGDDVWHTKPRLDAKAARGSHLGMIPGRLAISSAAAARPRRKNAGTRLSRVGAPCRDAAVHQPENQSGAKAPQSAWWDSRKAAGAPAPHRNAAARESGVADFCDGSWNGAED